jgi:hypothetical protein
MNSTDCEEPVACIKDAYIIQIEGLDEIAFLTGTVVYDDLGRFSEGDWFFSSQIKKIEQGVVHTKNNCYLTEVKPRYQKVSILEYKSIIQGIDVPNAKYFTRSFKND